MVIKLLFLISIFTLINCQNFMDFGPEYGYGIPPPLQTPMQYRSTKNNHFNRRDSSDQHATLRKFYELDLLKNYSLNLTDWSYLWFEFEEMSVKNQTTMIKELRSKQKTIEMILIQLCKDRCLRDSCEAPINDQTVNDQALGFLPRNSDSWLRFRDLEWDDIPLKIKKSIIFQLKIERFRTANSLVKMVNELCPYSKYFDEPNNRQPNQPNAENVAINGNSKIQVKDDHPPSGNNNLDNKPIEVN